eukprot:9314107-Prorocentrum_lima.AAC.1
MVRGSTLDVGNVSGDEVDKMWTETTMVLVHRFMFLPSSLRDLLNIMLKARGASFKPHIALR